MNIICHDMFIYYKRNLCPIDVPFELEGFFFVEFEVFFTFTIRKLSIGNEKHLKQLIRNAYLPRNSLKSIFPFLSKSMADVNSSMYASLTSPVPFSP